MAASDRRSDASFPLGGVAWAFTRGMDPRSKDGVRAHPLVFAGGVLLHLGVIAAAIVCAGLLAGMQWSSTSAWILGVCQGAGAAAGVGLIVRRVRSPRLRVISEPDDYASTALVVAVLATGAASTMTVAAQVLFVGLTGALVGYAPFSKIRHCILFFPLRVRYGLWVGRRGLFVQPTRRS